MEYLRSRSDVRPESIAILGQSYGGLAMLFTVADDRAAKQRATKQGFPGCDCPLPKLPPARGRKAKLETSPTYVVLDG